MDLIGRTTFEDPPNPTGSLQPTHTYIHPSMWVNGRCLSEWFSLPVCHTRPYPAGEIGSHSDELMDTGFRGSQAYWQVLCEFLCVCFFPSIIYIFFWFLVFTIQSFSLLAARPCPRCSSECEVFERPLEPAGTAASARRTKNWTLVNGEGFQPVWNSVNWARWQSPGRLQAVGK